MELRKDVKKKNRFAILTLQHPRRLETNWNKDRIVCMIRFPTQALS
ncbi:hypothetical protein [Leptospira yasudae]|nr:hypothetical protein [Leptospira yasudae]